MSTIGERLVALRENKSLTQAQVAEIIGVDRTSYAKYEANVNKPTRKLKELSDLFNVNSDYIMCLTDVPNKLDNFLYAKNSALDRAAQKMHTNEVLPPTDNIRIPIIGSVKCGYDGLAYEYLDGYVMIDNTKLHGDIKAFRCRGDSMNGIGIFDGDIAIVRVQDDVECGELAIVIVDGDEGTLKRIRRQEGAIILESANPSYPPRVFTGEAMNKVRVVGKVVEIRRQI